MSSCTWLIHHWFASVSWEGCCTLHSSQYSLVSISYFVIRLMSTLLWGRGLIFRKWCTYHAILICSKMFKRLYLLSLLNFLALTRQATQSTCHLKSRAPTNWQPYSHCSLTRLIPLRPPPRDREESVTLGGRGEDCKVTFLPSAWGRVADATQQLAHSLPPSFSTPWPLVAPSGYLYCLYFISHLYLLILWHISKIPYIFFRIRDKKVKLTWAFFFAFLLSAMIALLS